ncbi:MAG: tetratricopeptide repeat protein, partial [Methylococcales bacterium]|nr:tetratricopeptide repeat protein [Methylococcales bacterium]
MHDTEEEQIEAMKKWWEENGKSVIFGLCIGVVAIVGWNVWSSHKVEQGQEASSLYTKLSQNVDTDIAYAETLNATIQDDFSSTVYAQLSEMKLAKVKLASKDQAAAIAHLQKVVGS